MSCSKKGRLIILILFIIIIYIKFKKNNLEIKLNRYINFNNKTIIIKKEDEKLFSIIKYVNLLKQQKEEKILYFKKITNPKISFISPIFNQENYLITFILSVQNQNLKNYELIFVDDFSKDNSVKIVNKIKEKDKRIKLIRNKRNMGTLYSRYIGEINAKANFIIFVDCDDIILKNGIFNTYNHITNYNLDIVQFLAVHQDKINIFINYKFYKYKKIISKPILSYIHFYNNHKGNELNVYLWNKLIKKEIAIKAFKYIGKKYYKNNIVMHNDVIVLFSLFQIANSFQHINEIGYYYISTHKNSVHNLYKNLTKSNEIIHSLFTSINFLYEKTKDTYLDKYFCIFKINDYFRQFNNLFQHLNNKEINYITKILKRIKNSNYISLKDKLNIFKIEILNNYYNFYNNKK